MYPGSATKKGGAVDLKEHRALVTGGALRIGAAIARALAAEGCDVAVHCNRSRAEADALAGALQRMGVRAAVVVGALDAAGQAEAVVDRAWEALGGLDLLVNNASVFHKDRLQDASEAHLRHELEVNLVAPMLCTRRFVQRRAEASDAAAPVRRGCVVNLLDRRVAGAEAGCLPYLVSKMALADFTRVAALELAPHVRVNGVAPGAVLPPPGKGEDYLRDAAGFVPLAVRTRPEDVAAAVVYLARAESVTGQVLYVDGGQHLCRASAT